MTTAALTLSIQNMMLAGAAFHIGWMAAQFFCDIVGALCNAGIKSLRTQGAAKPSDSKPDLVLKPWPASVPPPKRPTAPATRRRH